MIYLAKVLSLKERASIEVAIDLCQDNGFKEVVLCLQKPTYGALIFEESVFTIDPKKLSIWDKINKNKMKTSTRIYHELITSFKPRKEDSIKQWYSAVDEQCKRLTKGIPHFLRDEICVWINHIALEYLNYCWQQERLIGISRYFFMDIFSREDWTGTGRLDEKKIAGRLLEDERLTVHQKLHIARAFYFRDHICKLLNIYKMQQQQQFLQVFCSFSDPYFDGPAFTAEKLVSTWWHYMNDSQNEIKARKEIFLILRDTIRAGYEMILMQFWQMLKEYDRQGMVVSLALESLQYWQNTKSFDWRNALILNEPHRTWPYNNEICPSRLPSHYCMLLRFFLLRMNEEQQMKFFQLAFQNESVLDCFLEWPFQDEFLPTINRLWGIIPQHMYTKCLITLACKYSRNYDKGYFSSYLEPHNKMENSYYDYRSLLWRLWEETPQSYQQYVFSYSNTERNRAINEDEILLPLMHKRFPFEGKDYELFKLIWRGLWEETPESYKWKWNRYFNVVLSSYTNSKILNEGTVLLLCLLKRSPFQEKDEVLFKRIWRDVPQEQKMELVRCKTGCYIFSILVTKEKWSFLNWLLEECLPKDKIPICKKQFIQSRTGSELCLSKLMENQAEWLEEFINWSLDTHEEKTQFKYKLISGDNGLHMCMVLLSKRKFYKVEHIMNICLSLNEIKDLDAKEKEMEFKNTLFSLKGVDIHSHLVFYERQWNDVKEFYTWFNLSSQEITTLKRKTIFLPKNIEYVQELLYQDKYEVLTPLFWCLTDGEMVLELMNEIEKGYSKEMTSIKKEEAEELQKFLMKEFRKKFCKDAKKMKV